VTVEKKDLSLSSMPLGGDLEHSKELEELEEWKRKSCWRRNGGSRKR